MKTILILILKSLLLLNINAQINPQDTLSHSYLSKNMENMTYNPIPKNNNPTYWKSAITLFSTFLINSAIITHDTKQQNLQHTTQKTGFVYITGTTISTIFFFRYNKNYE